MKRFTTLFLLFFLLGYGIASHAAEPIRIGILAYRPIPIIQAQWAPMAEALNKEMPEYSFQIQPLDFMELEQATASRQIDFILTTPNQYILLRNRYGLSSPLATVIRFERGRRLTAYAGVIITLAKRTDINTLEDLRDKSIATASREGLSSYLAPAYELELHDIHLPQDARLIETGQPNDKVVEAVLAGRADAGFVRSGLLEDLARSGKLDMNLVKIINPQDLSGFGVVASTRLYPEWPFAAIPHIDKDLARKISANLLLFEQNLKQQESSGIYGFTIPSDYLPVENLLRELRLPPFDRSPEFTLLDVWRQYRWWIVGLLVSAGLILALLFSVWRSKQRLGREREIVLAQRAQLTESEQRYRFLFDNNPMPMWVFAEGDLKFLEVNKRATEHYGYSREEFAAMTLRDMRPPEELNVLQQALAASPNGIITTEAIHCKKDGTPINVIVSTMPMRYQGIAARIALVDDITERKRAESALKYERDFADNLIEAAQAIILILDSKGCILRYNKFMENLCGYPLSEMAGKEWMTNFLPEHEQNRIRELFKKATSGTRTQGNVNAILTRSGEERLIEWYDKELKDPDGNVIGLLAVGHDITQRHKIAEELRQYQEQLEEKVQQRTAELVLARDAAEAANKAKSVFLANMSHELRTPLNAILGFSAMLRKNPDLPSEQREEIDIINRSGNHLLTLINDVLEMSRIEAGRVELENTAFDMGGMIRDVTDMMQIRAGKKGLQLLVDQSSQFPRFIVGDEARLRQILINLIGNAIKFTHEGGVTLRLGILPDHGTHLLIEVEDTGIGIAPEDRQRIFEPFVQLGEHSLGKGSGLGLAITRQFVQLMGGTISVESKPGKGSLFRLVLPLHEAAISEIEARPTREQSVVGLATGQPEYRILIAEDQPENQLLLKRLMADIGLPHRVAENGKQAVEQFQSWKPHLILMDRRMPEMDGVEATRTIRELPGGRDVKIVAVTASAFKEQRDEMLAAGMDGFVGKPYRMTEIYDCLTQQLGIKFIYEDGEQQRTPAAALAPQMLSVLPGELREELKDALESLDGKRIRAALKSVGERDRQLEALLAKLVDDYAYPAILNALTAARKRSGQ